MAYDGRRNVKPFTSSGRRWARAAGVFSMLAILVTLTSPVRAASTPLTGSTFDASDGNLVKETGTTDWCNATDTSGLCTALAPNF